MMSDKEKLLMLRLEIVMFLTGHAHGEGASVLTEKACEDARRYFRTPDGSPNMLLEGMLMDYKMSQIAKQN